MDLQIIHTTHGSLAVPASHALRVRREMTIDEEAKRCPEAVVNRLCNQGRYDEAEVVLDLYV